MREFDDASRLATFIPQTQLGDSIADLQRIRRAAEDEKVPGCLTNLQGYQIAHMNAVIDTLLLFMRSSTPLNFDCVEVQPNTEEEVACKSIAFAQEQHDQYLVELARLLGLTVVPATPAAAPSETTTP
jgi:hypothetical protein